MKHKLLFLTILFALINSTVSAQDFASRVTLTFKSDSGAVINAISQNAVVYYNTVTDELRVRVDISSIVVMQDSALTDSFNNLGTQWLLFNGVLSQPDKFLLPNNVDNFPVNGAWSFRDKSIGVESTYTTQVFPGQQQTKVRLSFLSVFDSTNLQIPVLSDLASYELSISLPDAYVNLVSQF